MADPFIRTDVGAGALLATVNDVKGAALPGPFPVWATDDLGAGDAQLRLHQPLGRRRPGALRAVPRRRSTGETLT
jgi:hypothetical protein